MTEGFDPFPNRNNKISYHHSSCLFASDWGFPLKLGKIKDNLHCVSKQRVLLFSGALCIVFQNKECCYLAGRTYGRRLTPLLHTNTKIQIQWLEICICIWQFALIFCVAHFQTPLQKNGCKIFPNLSDISPDLLNILHPVFQTSCIRSFEHLALAPKTFKCIFSPPHHIIIVCVFKK